jgi:hypothetical protein
VSGGNVANDLVRPPELPEQDLAEGRVRAAEPIARVIYIEPDIDTAPTPAPYARTGH